MDEIKTSKNDLASLLRDFAQGASNSVAGNVAVPVDAIAWLLRKGGVNVPTNPVMGSDWMAEKGLTREPQNKLAGFVGDMAGMVAPFAAASKAPQIARGLLAGSEGAATAGKWLGKEALRPVNDAILYGEGPLRKILPESPKIFIGQNAQNFDKNSLAQALKMEKEGVDPKQIWSETGSMRAPWDKQWRQEIDDSAASIPYSADRTGRADMFVKHPELFNGYPDMAGMGFKVDSELLKPLNGSYIPQKDLISLGSGNTSTGLHEIQHAIQRREGFAKGGSPSMFDKPPMDIARQNIASTVHFASDWTATHPGTHIDDILDDLLDIITEPKKGFKHEGNYTNNDLGALIELMNTKDKNAFVKKWVEESHKPVKDSVDQYKKLAGEAEARAVQTRMNMNEAQRRATYPLDSFDVPVDQLITRYGDAPAMSQGNERLLKILERNGEGLAPKYPQSQALELAQQRAALPVSEGGLGLPANNTAMDRANVMGFDTPAYHGTSNDFTSMKMGGEGKTYNAGAFSTNNPALAATYASSEGGNVLPLLLKEGSAVNVEGKGANWNWLNDKTKISAPKISVADVEGDKLMADLFGKQNSMPSIINRSAFSKSLGKKFPDDFRWNDAMSTDDIARWANEQGYSGVNFNAVRDRGPNGVFHTSEASEPSNIFATFNPDDIRSRFAAFDPWRRNAAIAATMGVAAPDLLANPLDDKNNRLIEILKRNGQKP
jgi:hypothetical protein